MKRNSMSKILNSTMKKIGFILSFFFFVFPLMAQEYIPLVKEGLQIWTIDERSGFSHE